MFMDLTVLQSERENGFTLELNAVSLYYMDSVSHCTTV